MKAQREGLGMVLLIIGLIRTVVIGGVQTPGCTCDMTINVTSLRALVFGTFPGDFGTISSACLLPPTTQESFQHL